MTLTFAEDRSNNYLIYFAIAQNEVYRGKIAEELMFAELVPGEDGVKVVWEDDFYHPVILNTLEEAKRFVLNHYYKHTPHVNGSLYDEYKPQ